VASCALVKLHELTLDGPHPRHQTVKLGEEVLFLLSGQFHAIHGRTMANALQSIGQLPIQEPHAVLQVQEFLLELSLLDHGKNLTREIFAVSLS
jgi:hypothetical protein